jgi:hypothetical protein
MFIKYKQCMELDQGYWIQFGDNTLITKKESRSASFGTKVVPCLWRADLNSVTGSS